MKSMKFREQSAERIPPKRIPPKDFDDATREESKESLAPNNVGALESKL